MNIYKQKLNILLSQSPGKDATYPIWGSHDRLWIDTFTFLTSDPSDLFMYKEATKKERKLYNTFKKLRKL